MRSVFQRIAHLLLVFTFFTRLKGDVLVADFATGGQSWSAIGALQLVVSGGFGELRGAAMNSDIVEARFTNALDLGDASALRVVLRSLQSGGQSAPFAISLVSEGPRESSAASIAVATASLTGGELTTVTIPFIASRTFNKASVSGVRLFGLGPVPLGQVAVAIDSITAVSGTGASPVIMRSPQSGTRLVGESITFTVESDGSEFQWLKDGVPIPDARSASYTIASISQASAGQYTVRVSGPGGVTVSGPATLVVESGSAGARAILSNLSVRTPVVPGSSVIVGLTMGGGAKAVLVRGIGPALAQFGVAGSAVDPVARLFGSNGALVLENDNWAAGLDLDFARLGAFPLPAGSKDAAFRATLEGGYTVQVVGAGGAGGVVLVELYDAGVGDTVRFTNISARNRAGQNADVLIAGFVVAGQGTVRLLIRGIGPSLAGFGVPGVLADPKLEVSAVGGSPVGGNDNWEPSLAPIFGSVGAFALSPGSRDSAVVLTLQPGGYTAQVSGINGGTGEALIEVYVLP